MGNRIGWSSKSAIAAVLSYRFGDEWEQRKRWNSVSGNYGTAVHKFKATPDSINSADFDIDQARRKSKLTHRVFAQVHLPAGSFFRPGNPENSARFQTFGKNGENRFQRKLAIGEEMKVIVRFQIEFGIELRHSNQVFKSIGSADDCHRNAGFNAELGSKRAFGISVALSFGHMLFPSNLPGRHQMLPFIPAEGQYSTTSHFEHFGFRASQMARPCRMRTCAVSVHCEGLASCIRSCSLFGGSE